jgi:hypothetical protein
VSSDCSGDDVCVSCQCLTPQPYCGDDKVNGNEECDPTASPDGCDSPAVCGSKCKCVDPPSLDCESICSATSGAIPISGSYSSASECKAGAQSYFGSAPSCTTLCVYAWYYKVTNIAGSDSCCCAVKKTFQCTDCPGQNPQCPDPNTICPANAPSWVPPS